MLKQVSVFAENSRGTMQKITGILQDENINIWGSVTNDSAEYGIIRMVVSDPEKALEALKAAGYLVQLNDVMGVEVEDKVGNLNHVLLAFAAGNINVNYIYLSFNRRFRQAGSRISHRGYLGGGRVHFCQRIFRIIIKDDGRTEEKLRTGSFADPEYVYDCQSACAGAGRRHGPDCGIRKYLLCGLAD